MKYTKIPVTIDADEWNKVIIDVGHFRHPDISSQMPCKHCGKLMYHHGWIDTLEGGHIVCPGDFIITGVEGEKYPCKPTIFHNTYKKAIPNEQYITFVKKGELSKKTVDKIMDLLLMDKCNDINIDFTQKR